MDAKICGKCKLLKFDDEFYNDFAKSDNKAWSCKGCSREAKQTDCYKHQQQRPVPHLLPHYQLLPED